MKRLYKAILVVCLLCAGSPAVRAGGPVSEYEQLLQKAEHLLSNYKDSEALVLYEQVLELSPENYEALCKASYLHCRIGDRFSNETTKINHFAKAKKYAQKAYALQPADAEANYLMALSLGCEAMVSGAKQRLVGIHEIKSFLDAALAANGQHAGAWHALGRWYYKMANLNIAEKAAAKILFGGVCENATNEDAVAALEKAIAYDAGKIRYYYDLACVYEDMKNKEACISTLKSALTIQLETTEELELSRRCRIMLQKQQKL
ncbi:MAG: hypothetical protein LPK14_06450 [Hymenobacteraceae bacterium]|nr:hypothetical protein [Hymenobacteraceae bacterium]